MELRRFYFAHRELLVIPVEHLGEHGPSEAMSAALREDRRLGDGWMELLRQAYATYWVRAKALHERAPDTWFPPRLQNLCIVLEPELVRPYHQPFHKSSWMLYASDFDPEASNLEHATYQLLHAERLSTSRDMAMARHAYEYQYLSLGRVDDPLRYFLRSTWFWDYLVDTGLVPPPHLQALLHATAALCACYEVDDAAFVTPSPAPPDGARAVGGRS